MISIGLNVRMHDTVIYTTKAFIPKIRIKIIPTQLK